MWPGYGAGLTVNIYLHYTHMDVACSFITKLRRISQQNMCWMFLFHFLPALAKPLKEICLRNKILRSILNVPEKIRDYGLWHSVYYNYKETLSMSYQVVRKTICLFRV